MSSTMKDFSKKLFAVVAAFAMAMALVPAAALADDNDVKIDVYTYSYDSDTEEWDYSSVGQYNLTANAITRSADEAAYGYMYYKSGWQVLGTRTYVPVDTALAAAGSAWTAGSELYFTAIDSSTNAEADYTKASVSYNDLHTNGIFYGATLKTGDLVSSTSGNVDVPDAVFSLDATKNAVSATGTAADALAGISTFSTGSAPRLLWGSISTSQSANAGKRFPSNIVKVYVKGANDPAPFALAS